MGKTKKSGRRAWFKQLALRNPQRSDWGRMGGRPKVTDGPDMMPLRTKSAPTLMTKDEYYSVNILKTAIKVIDLYFGGMRYFFVEINYEAKIKCRSVIYDSRKAAMAAYRKEGGQKIFWAEVQQMEDP